MPNTSLLFSIYQRIRHTHTHTPKDAEFHILNSIKTVFPKWKYPSPLSQPHYMTGVHPRNKEKSFAKTLNLPLSTICRETLLENYHVPPQTRLNAYIQIAGSDLHRRDLFAPSLYLTLPTRISTKCLLRIHTQHTDEIPTHQYLTPMPQGKFKKNSYDKRICPICANHPTTSHILPPPVGSEFHYLFTCPHTPPLLHPFVTYLKSQLKFLCLPPQSGQNLSLSQQLSIALESSPPAAWKIRASLKHRFAVDFTNHAAILALRLSSHTKSL
jgi:hypothetical protein